MKAHARRDMGTCLWFVVGLYFVAMPITVQAGDTATARSDGGATVKTLAKHSIDREGEPTGKYHMIANSYDSLGTHGPKSIKWENGDYSENGKKSDTTEVSHDPGKLFDPQAQGSLTWGSGFWDSSSSFAKIADGLDKDSKEQEDAKAKAQVADPQTYSVKFNPNFKPEVDFSFTIAAGSTLVCHGAPNIDSSASLSGAYTTSLLMDGLWSFSWSADSSHLNSSNFQFWSNPLLGLNDGAILYGFLADVSDAGGVHTLRQDFTISAGIFPDLPDGQWDLTYSVGGATDYEAQAVASGLPTPEPPSLLLLALAFSASAASFANDCSREVRGRRSLAE